MLTKHPSSVTMTGKQLQTVERGLADMPHNETSIHPSKVLFPLGLGTALSLMGDATLYTVLPTHTVEAGVALSSVGILLGANRAVRLFLNGPAGMAYDRWPRRRLFVPALCVGALSTAIYAATRGFWPLLLGRLLWGLAWSGIWVGGATIILDVTTDQDRGRWTGLYQTWFFLGAASGAFVGGLLTDWLGYGTTMGIGATVTALGGLIALFLLPETRLARLNRPVDAAEIPPPRWHANQGLWTAVSLQAINRFVTAGVLTATMALLVQEQLLTTDLPLGVATLTGALMAGRTLLSTVAAPLAGTLSDRLGSRWKVILGGLVCGVVSMLACSGGHPHGHVGGRRGRWQCASPRHRPHRRFGGPSTARACHRPAAHRWRPRQCHRPACGLRPAKLALAVRSLPHLCRSVRVGLAAAPLAGDTRVTTGDYP
jgi:MFS family permease